MIIKKLCFSNWSEQHPICSIFLVTRRLCNKMYHVNYNMTEYLLRFHNTQKVKKSCNGSLIPRGLQEHGMKIIYPLHVPGFYTLTNNGKKEAEIAREELLCTIFYLENSDKSRFSDLKKHVDNDYILNKAEYPRTYTVKQGLLFNYQPNYNFNRQSQYQVFINQLMFVQRGKTGDY